MRGVLLAITLTTGLGGPVVAADAQGRYAVEGTGRLICKDMVAASGNVQTMRDLAAWMTGYMTAHNRLVPDTFDLTPWQTPGAQVFLVNQYCQSNPEDTVEQAAKNLVAFLVDDRLVTASTPVSQGVGSQITLIYPEVMEQAISALVEAGHTPSSGNEGLAAAIRAYQADVGITQSGLFDQSTLARLFE
ncbi:MAG: hypothetical protein AAGI36_07130 [Pseudomonadota bacterium]